MLVLKRLVIGLARLFERIAFGIPCCFLLRECLSGKQKKIASNIKQIISKYYSSRYKVQKYKNNEEWQKGEDLIIYYHI